MTDKYGVVSLATRFELDDVVSVNEGKHVLCISHLGMRPEHQSTTDRSQEWLGHSY